MDLQDLSQAGFPVVQEIKAVHGQVHHINGIAVLGPPCCPICPVKELVAVVVAHPPHQRRNHLGNSTPTVSCCNTKDNHGFAQSMLGTC